MWKLDRDAIHQELVESSPSVDEFEQHILSYKALIDQINREPEYLVVGTIAVYTGEEISRFFAERQTHRAIDFAKAK